ncbi:hypothetical protein KSP39_PZI010088 [Platanthera zijinensis]|uniref:Uncharacterized protein n=1 Tax=Platanthera zijinensis TaxID=2320716 RepID=A0AAP0BJV0_9ASPA
MRRCGRGDEGLRWCSGLDGVSLRWCGHGGEGMRECSDLDDIFLRWCGLASSACLESLAFSISAKNCMTKPTGELQFMAFREEEKIVPGIALQLLRRLSRRRHQEASRRIKGSQLSLLSQAQLSPAWRSLTHVLSGAAHSSSQLLGRRKKSSPNYPRAGRRRQSGAEGSFSGGDPLGFESSKNPGFARMDTQSSRKVLDAPATPAVARRKRKKKEMRMVMNKALLVEDISKIVLRAVQVVALDPEPRLWIVVLPYWFGSGSNPDPDPLTT